jgi:hypothetical protein
MSHPLFEAVRQRYRRPCGYCGVTEIAVGSELTLDHYRPRAAGGSDELDNLVYACIKCNQYKSDYWPDDADLAQGRRLLHPGIDDASPHLIKDETTGRLHGLTPTGVFQITVLRLNRPQLVAHRLARRLQKILEEKVRLLEQQNAELERTIEAQERYLDVLAAPPARTRRRPPS